jgi:hypothetical protein
VDDRLAHQLFVQHPSLTHTTTQLLVQHPFLAHYHTATCATSLSRTLPHQLCFVC